MRLTLRTLLAYLDDRLSPANAKELGQKIAKSPFTTELVERIREVKRRRRLAMPDKPVAMIDANLVAEYLDDQLTPELVARVEKEVLASDVMLAEVASAHEILGLLNDPVTIEQRLRDRLYALDPTGETDVVRALASDNSAHPAAATGDGVEWKPLPVPGESIRRVPIFIAVGLVIIWLAAILSDSVLLKPETFSQIVPVAGADAKVEVQPENNVEPGEIPAAGSDSHTEIKQHAPTLDIGTVESPGDKNPVVADVNPDERPATDVPAGKTVSTDAAPVAAPPDAVPIVAAADVPAAIVPDLPADKVEPGKANDPTKANVTVHVMSSNKTFFVFDESVDRWMKLDQIPGGEIVSTTRNTADCRSLFQQHWFAVAEPFTADLSSGDSGWIAMISGTVLARLPSVGVHGLEIYSGRMKLSVDATQPWDEGRLPQFSLTTAGVTSMLVLQTKDAVVGVEVVPVANSMQKHGQTDWSDADPRSAAALLQLSGADFQVKVTVVTGQAAVRLSGIDQEIILTKGNGLSWLAPDFRAPDSSDPAVVASIPENITPDDGTQIAAVPAWLYGDIKPVHEAEALSSLIREALANGDDPAQAMIPMLSNRNPQLGVRAVHILTATCDVEHLLSALFEPLDEAVHRAAIDGLSHIANGSAAGRRTIRTALETRMPMSEVDITVSLIEGFGDAEARDAAYCKTVIDLLNSDRLATRVLTLYRIQQYSNDRLGYQPDAEPSRRRVAVRRWEKLIDRRDGKLLP